MEFTKSIGKGDFNFEARPNDVLFLKKKGEKKKEERGKQRRSFVRSEQVGWKKEGN